MMMRGIRPLTLAVVLGAGAMLGAEAQVPPQTAEVQAYAGLHRAAWFGDLPKLKSLIASGTNLDARDARGRTPLHVAAHARQREAVTLLAKAGANLDALEDDRYDAVTIASVADDVPTLALLLSLGASARQVTSRYDGTALIAAAHLGHDEVVRQLIAAGAPLDHVNNLHWTAAIEAVVLGDGGPRHQRTLAALVGAGANLQLADRQGNTPLQLAKARGYTAMASLLEAQRPR
ncbi:MULTISPECIES: ankyrin repeat domain-containing protein [Variovorax]|uniref:ankyrin repeat domain-containing protein n=1 Tax=Variovorax TaxID=34072 RepID=UPI002859877C|nr:ankyrin repeat domain-containing protein [Variovorax sp. 3319]MDR6889079.1 ankyrin repeat protein [Variovorax sp. 3319]